MHFYYYYSDLFFSMCVGAFMAFSICQNITLAILVLLFGLIILAAVYFYERQGGWREFSGCGFELQPQLQLPEYNEFKMDEIKIKRPTAETAESAAPEKDSEWDIKYHTSLYIQRWNSIFGTKNTFDGFDMVY